MKRQRNRTRTGEASSSLSRRFKNAVSKQAAAASIFTTNPGVRLGSDSGIAGGGSAAVIAELIGRCMRLRAPAGPMSLAAAWQHAACLVPDAFPTLEELGSSSAMVVQSLRLPGRWPHVKPHLEVIHLLANALPDDWQELVEALPRELMIEAAAGPWTDIAGDVLTALRDHYAGGIVLPRAYTTPPKTGVAIGEAVRPLPQSALLDPMCRTGASLGYLADAVARADQDPSTCQYVGLDTDVTALAVAAVNLIGARAGPSIWLEHGDLFTVEFVRPDGTLMTFDRVVSDLTRGVPELQGPTHAKRRDVVIDVAARRTNQARRGDAPAEAPSGTRPRPGDHARDLNGEDDEP